MGRTVVVMGDFRGVHLHPWLCLMVCALVLRLVQVTASEWRRETARGVRVPWLVRVWLDLAREVSRRS
jgi:hypothetical protein